MQCQHAPGKTLRLKACKTSFGIVTSHRARDMLHWYDLVCAWPMVEACLGWIPCLYLQGCARRCAPSQQGIRRLLDHLAKCGLLLPPTPQVPFGTLVRLLEALALSTVRRFDDPSIQGPSWQGDGTAAPRMELRVAVRYLRQAPARPWDNKVRGTRIAAQFLQTVFPEHAFDAALRFLQERGRDFYLHRTCSRRYRDLNGYIHANNVQVTTLHCVVMDFEVLLRCSRARDPVVMMPCSSESDTP